MKMNRPYEALIVAFISAALINIIALPLLLIWSINTLLAMHIDFTIWNWLASWVLVSCFRGVKVEMNK